MTYKRFVFEVTEAEKLLDKSFDLDKNIIYVHAIQLTSNQDKLLENRGEQKISIGGEEMFPAGYESKLLMSSLDAPANARYFPLGEALPGNGLLEVSFKDVAHPDFAFVPYKVSVYLAYTRK